MESGDGELGQHVSPIGKRSEEGDRREWVRRRRYRLLVVIVDDVGRERRGVVERVEELRSLVSELDLGRLQTTGVKDKLEGCRSLESTREYIRNREKTIPCALGLYTTACEWPH